MSTAKLNLNGKDYDLPVIVGTENETAVDATKLRAQSGAITYDPGYGNTGSCKSAITFIDGEQGILRYRGYPIEQLAERARFTEVAYLLIYGELPNRNELRQWQLDITDMSLLHERQVKLIDHFPLSAHPMGILASLIASGSSFYPTSEDDELVEQNIRRLIAQVKTAAGFTYKWSIGEPFVYPRRKLSYCANFLRMMFGGPTENYEAPEVLERALRMLLIVHADHEQNCSTSTVRMVGSSQANIFASMAAGICALWGPRHGGANQAVIEMLQEIQQTGVKPKEYMEKVKTDPDVRLMGFGHRVYKNFDPRAEILKKSSAEVLEHLGINEPLLDIAKQLEEVALKDDYFVERKLYPNVDFYSGILYRAMKIPVNMFTVMFAIGRMPGWLAHWKEMRDEGQRIHRPRQIYTGATERPYPAERR